MSQLVPPRTAEYPLYFVHEGGLLAYRFTLDGTVTCRTDWGQEWRSPNVEILAALQANPKMTRCNRATYKAVGQRHDVERRWMASKLLHVKNDYYYNRRQQKKKTNE